MDRNLLDQASSPYLLQHADNPVHWMPWSEAALARARERDCPILLSIGYSACHWCHVMAHESFEDPSTAALMNSLFVNIKVDREERPDLDRVYQSAHQLLIRRAGGWPLTMFLTPDEQLPFFGGTYFPDEARHGMPSFAQVLTRVSLYFHEHRDEIRGQRDALVAALESLEPTGKSEDRLDASVLEAARNALEEQFDRRHGGFGDAPKFPHPSNLERLLRHHAARLRRGQGQGDGDTDALGMAIGSVHAMSNGGLYDHLGGGFYRYSTDAAWMIPHFEKMLYDNGPLLELSARCLQITGDPHFAAIARETAAWTMREMQDPRGGYYASLDADSEGEEGRYYVWTPGQVQALLDGTEFAVFGARFGLDRAPNFEDSHWHLHGFETVADAAANAQVDEAQAHDLLATARAKLFEARERRARPALDDKVLAAWNGLMIKGMSVAADALGDASLATSASRAFDFVRDEMVVHGRLHACWRDGVLGGGAYLDDHALLLDAALALLQLRWRDADMDFAVFLAEALLEHFHDDESGGFFFTAHDHEQLIARPKPMADEALPSGNGVAARTLARLGHLLGEPRYLDAAESTLRAAWDALQRFPHAHNAMLDALEEYLEPPACVVIRGRGEALERWRRRAVHAYAPTRVTIAIPVADAKPPGLLAHRAPADDVIAYVCRGTTCDAPVRDYDAFDAIMRESELPPPR